MSECASWQVIEWWCMPALQASPSTFGRAQGVSNNDVFMVDGIFYCYHIEFGSYAGVFLVWTLKKRWQFSQSECRKPTVQWLTINQCIIIFLLSFKPCCMLNYLTGGISWRCTHVPLWSAMKLFGILRDENKSVSFLFEKAGGSSVRLFIVVSLAALTDW